MFGTVRLVTYKKRQIYEEVLLDLIAKARTSIKLATANIRNFRVQIFEESFPLSDYMKYFANEEVQVKILTTPNALRSSFVTELRETQNVEIRACARNHLKVVIVDARRAYVGTANLTSSGLGARPVSVRNFEIGFITKSAPLIAAVEIIFDDIWRGAFCDSCSYKDRTDIKCTKIEL